MSESVPSSDKKTEEDKRIRLLYQSLLERRRLNCWNILDFPYLAEIVRHDSAYLRRILTSVFIDHPVLSQYLSLIAWKQVSKQMNRCKNSKHLVYKCEMLPIGFERTLWLIYKRQCGISDVWSPKASSVVFSPESELPRLNFTEFLSKITGLVVDSETQDSH